MKRFGRLAAAGLLAAAFSAGGARTALAQDAKTAAALAQAQLAMALAQAKARAQAGRQAPSNGGGIEDLIRRAQVAMMVAQAQLALAQAQRAAGPQCKRLIATTSDPLQPYKIVKSCPAGKSPERSDYPMKGDCVCSGSKPAPPGN